MAKRLHRSTKVTGLRTQAEALLRTTKRDVAAMPVKDVQQLVHELQLHQIELDMQNDKLRQIQVELEAARDRYMDLYDFSPVGHLTLDMRSTIVEANLRATTLLGLNRQELIGQPLVRFMAETDQATFQRHCQEVMKTGTRHTCEVQLRPQAGDSCYIYLESLAVHEESGRITHWQTAFLDISDRKQAEHALRTTKEKLQQALFASKTGLWDWNTDTNEMFYSREWKSQLGYGEQDLANTFETWDALMHTDDQERAKAYVQAYLKNPVGDYVQEFRLRHKDGSYRWIGTVASFVVEPDGRRVRLLGSHTDITRRKIAEKALQASEAFTRTVLDSLSAHVCVLDEKGNILRTNDAWREFAQEHVGGVFTLGKVGDNFLACCRHLIAGDASTSQAILNGVEAVLKGNQPSFSAEYQELLPEVPRWFLMRVTPLKESQGVVISHTDISEQVRMARSLEQHILLLGEKREELELLTGKLIKAQEQERKRIARDLHDDFNQRLAALSVELESMERPSLALPEPVAGQLAAIRIQIGQLSDDLHDLAYKLHPSLLEHVGLEVAMRDHVTEFAKRTDLPVTFDARQVPKTLSQEMTTNLFRVMQESLQNVSKHAQATNVTVRLVGSSKGIGLSVRDNGKGFNLERKGAYVRGLGLVSMQERARGLGGFLRIHSLPRAGTKVCVWIPQIQERC
jgi:PAS domain S-box-containing protein